MNNDQKKYFTRRLTQCNRGELVVIMYDILLVYLADAKCAFDEERFSDYNFQIDNSCELLGRMIQDLDFKYDLAKQLYQLYMFSRNQLYMAKSQRKKQYVEEAESILVKLHEAFREVAEKDTSKPLMSNTEKVYTGMTYGRNSLNQSVTLGESNRGFLV